MKEVRNNKINLMIVGAQKAATTSLLRYLGGHPHISAQRAMEFGYFVSDKEFEKGFESVFEEQMELKTNSVVNLAKSATMSSNEVALQRLAKHNPDCRLIFLVRNPVERAYSSYTMAVNRGWMEKEFSELRSIIESGNTDDIMYRNFIKLGIYSEQVDLLTKYFPKENLRVFLFEELTEKPQEICTRILEWLDLDTNYEPETNKKHNETKEQRSKHLKKVIEFARSESNPAKRLAKSVLPYSVLDRLSGAVTGLNNSSKRYEKISAEMRRFLSEYYRPHNETLSEAVEIDLSRWSSDR